MTCGRSSRMTATRRPTASSSGALAKLSGRALVSVSGMPESWYPRRCSDEYPMVSTLARNSAMRTSGRLSRTSGVSAPGFRMSPASPPVQQTSTQRMPSSVYFATVPAPFDASSSGCASTLSRHSGLPAWSRGVASMRDDSMVAVAAGGRLGLCDRLLGPLEQPDFDPPDVADAAAAQALPVERRVVTQRVVEVARRQHAAGPGELHEPARQVDDRPVVVTFLGDN